MKFGGLKVLIVDDHAVVRDGLRAAIRAAFPRALIADAGSASEAQASISARRPELVLLDVNLPGESGLELARHIQANDKRIKLLFVAGEADPWTVNEAVQAGASGFVKKTQSAEFLGEAIKQVLAGKVMFCSEAQVALERAEHSGQRAPEPPGPSVLSARELEVLRYIAHGENTKAIAALLQISPKTIETHRQHIIRKLGLPSAVALARYALRHGLTTN
jgi:DNA-binding NarL/FixJ family response regulator